MSTQTYSFATELIWFLIIFGVIASTAIILWEAYRDRRK